MIDQPIICTVVHIHDGDGPYWCRGGPKIRVAGVQAPDFTRAEPCRRRKPGYVCDDRLAEASRQIAERLVLHKTLTCQQVGRSWKRAVAVCKLRDGSDIRCALNAFGATVDWPAYVTRYRLGRC